MEGRNRISHYRQRLDKTLRCHDLTDEGALRELVRNHLLKSSQNETEADIQSFLENRTKVISKFLATLRSASAEDLGNSRTYVTSHEWKVKQDREDCRVMYREGPPGSLFHELLVEGYIDGPIDSSLCVATEAPLYSHWWPQYSIPTFRIISSECLHKVRIGEQIASVRMKISWPISSRECLFHYIEFEYFQEDLIIVLLNSISDPNSLEKTTHGITSDLIPVEANDMVRMGLVGGFALQKVTNDRCYFRTIGSMDLKLDYVPSWLVNFIVRQLIGSGFKLYKKAVSSCSTANEQYKHALDDPLYVRTREALLSERKSDVVESEASSVGDTADFTVEKGDMISSDSESNTNQIVVDDGKTVERLPIAPKTPPGVDMNVICEIEEGSDDCFRLKEETGSTASQITNDNEPQENILVSSPRKVHPRPEVIEALATLDKVISVVRELGMNLPPNPASGVGCGNLVNTDSNTEEETSKYDELSLKGLLTTGASEQCFIRQTSNEPRESSSNGSSRAARISSGIKEVSRCAIAPASSPDLNIHNPNDTTHVTVGKTGNNWSFGVDDNGTKSTDRNKPIQQKKYRFRSCLDFTRGCL